MSQPDAGNAGSLAEALAAAAPAYSSITCRFGAWADTLPEADQVALWNAVRGSVTIREVARICTNAGHDVSPATIQNHRNNDCKSCRSRTT